MAHEGKGTPLCLHSQAFTPTFKSKALALPITEGYWIFAEGTGYCYVQLAWNMLNPCTCIPIKMAIQALRVIILT